SGRGGRGRAFPRLGERAFRARGARASPRAHRPGRGSRGTSRRGNRERGDRGPLPAAGPESAATGRPSGRITGPHPPLDDAELPELVVTEFKGPTPLRPAGLEHTRASAGRAAAHTPPPGR